MLFHKIPDFKNFQNLMLAHLIVEYQISEEAQQNLMVLFDHHIKSMEEANRLYEQAGEAIILARGFQEELELVKSQKLRVCDYAN
jgi:hypothetical protein